MTPTPTAPAAARTGPLNAAGAKLHIETLLGHLDGARKAVRSLDRRAGWSALGYTSCREALAAELERCPIRRPQRERLLKLLECWTKEEA